MVVLKALINIFAMLAIIMFFIAVGEMFIVIPKEYLGIVAVISLGVSMVLGSIGVSIKD